MENVLLIIHLLLALGLIAVVLLQRSEGGGLGMGGGGAVSGRAAATALGKLTWLLGVAFLITSISLTIIVAQKSSGASVIDRLGAAPASQSEDGGTAPASDNLLPPTADDNAPLVPAAD
ncbi:preprotein translocase subunit SecG [Sulfitobacter sp. EhC04]|uniref:preprotein translocase subunit SecG n=1 Tax=Sulfitobacter sp. EhC04 TaxID=1849168 RepID=UPI0007F50D5B|nr:preprotein translocase subunit SecG [Sulfitobacter sp. EhC04]OAN74411.1 preprotein translocase subunit SecG [Sulfitobacter sp. EhC04]